ncbi:MAG: hypothetical protein LBN33_10655 [Desulfovibrio sp.]|nr:hypothetical protein [Desulfovibrio sp.]
MESLGFVAQITRSILCAQIIFSSAALLIGATLTTFTLIPIAFAAGAALSTFSLWHIARFAEKFTNTRFSVIMGLKLFFGFTLRLIFIGAVLFLLMAPLKFPPVPILIGLGTTIIAITFKGAAIILGKTIKED